MRSILLTFLLLGSVAAHADDGADAPADAPTQDAPTEDAPKDDAPPAPEKPKMLVLDLQTSGVEAEQVKLLDELLTVELAKLEGFDVLSGADVRRMVELEAEKQTAGCEDSSCLADIAGAMGARYVVYGRIGKLGSRVVLTLNLFDSESAGAVGRSELKPDSMDSLPDELPGAVQRLVVGLVGKGAPAEPATASATSTSPATEQTTPAAESGGGGVMAIVWPIGFASAGAAVLLGGLAFDMLSPTSDDGTLEAGDFVGPGIMALGVATAVVGLVWNPFAGGDDA